MLLMLLLLEVLLARTRHGGKEDGHCVAVRREEVTYVVPWLAVRRGMRGQQEMRCAWMVAWTLGKRRMAQDQLLLVETQKVLLLMRLLLFLLLWLLLLWVL